MSEKAASEATIDVAIESPVLIEGDSLADLETGSEPAGSEDGEAEIKPEPAGKIKPETLTGDLEAMLMTSGRAVAVGRLAVALGLVASEEALAAEQPAETEVAHVCDLASPVGSSDEATAAQAPQTVAKHKKRRKRKARPSGQDPEELIGRAVAMLNATYEKTSRAFRIELVAGGYRVVTLAVYAKAVATLHGLAAQQKLSKAAVETLAIIAYKQPVTKSTLEAIRGVSCGEVLRSLLERRLVTIAGRAEELGRPILYATSKGFLEAFGLGSLRDLPSTQEITGRAAANVIMPEVVIAAKPIPVVASADTKPAN